MPDGPPRRTIVALTVAAVAAAALAVAAFDHAVRRRMEQVIAQGSEGPAETGLAGLRIGAERSLDSIAPGQGEHPCLEDVRAVLVAGEEVWIGTTGGLRVLRVDGGGDERVFTARSGLLRSDVVGLARQRDTIIVAHPEEGLSLVRGDRVRTLSHPDLVPTCVAATEERVYVGTVGQGLLAFADDRLWPVSIAGESAEGPWVLDAPRITALAVDAASGDLWVGTFDQGVAVLGEGGWRRLGTGDGLADPFVTALAAGTRGTGALVAVGTQAGLTLFDRGRATLVGVEQGLPDDHVSAVLVEPERVVVGTFGGGLALRHRGEWTRLGAAGLPSGHVGALASDGRGTVWIGTRQGLARMDRDGLEVVGAPPGPPGPRITALARSPDASVVWVGTFEHGLGRLDGGGWTRYGADEGLPSLEVNALCVHRGVLWVATNGGAAYLSGGRFRAHPRLDSLRGRAVTALLSDGEALWLGTARGVVRLAADGTVAALGVRDGLINAHVYALARTPGAVWAGTLGGLSGLRPDGAPDPVGAPRVEPGPGGLSHGWVNALLARGDELWVGTYGGGVDRFDGQGWRRVAPAGGEALEINPGAACWLGDRALFGTLDRGVLVVDADGGRARALDREIGLSSPSVSALMADGARVWIGTSAGLETVEAGALAP